MKFFLKPARQQHKKNQFALMAAAMGVLLVVCCFFVFKWVVRFLDFYQGTLYSNALEGQVVAAEYEEFILYQLAASSFLAAMVVLAVIVYATFGGVGFFGLDSEKGWFCRKGGFVRMLQIIVVLSAAVTAFVWSDASNYSKEYRDDGGIRAADHWAFSFEKVEWDEVNFSADSVYIDAAVPMSQELRALIVWAILGLAWLASLGMMCWRFVYLFRTSTGQVEHEPA